MFMSKGSFLTFKLIFYNFCTCQISNFMVFTYIKGTLLLVIGQVATTYNHDLVLLGVVMTDNKISHAL